MARKGKEADVQVFVKTDEEWEKIMEPEVSNLDFDLMLLDTSPLTSKGP